jgi:hypothetical protein
VGRPLESRAEGSRGLPPHAPHAALSHRGPGPGFSFENLVHAAAAHAPGAIAHDRVREEKGLRPGGFGLVLIRAIADELIYNERQNEVGFIKYLDESHGATSSSPSE